jgi:FkbM family methyltransferase
MKGMQPEAKKDRLHRSAKTKLLNLGRTVFMFPPLEQALARVTRGSTVESPLGKLPANYYQYPKPSLRSVVRDGIAFELDIADLVDWAIYFGYRQQAKDRLFALARPGDTVIDAGTNIGEMLLRFAKIVTPSGHVYGFEPDPANHGKCRRNLSLNSFDNLTLEQLALGREEGTLNLVCVDDRNPGMNRIVGAQAPAPAGRSARVRALSLDKYVSEKEIGRIDLIKIDVEGFEMSVLEGARATLERFRPRLFIEVCDEFLKANGGGARALVTWLLTLPYSITHASTGAPIDASTDLTGCATDIICLPR